MKEIDMPFGWIAGAGLIGTIYSAERSASAMEDASNAASGAANDATNAANQLGRDQLAEARRQYDLNYGVIGPVVDTQLDIMREGLRQGRESYDYSKQFRPLEMDMLAVAKDWQGQLTYEMDVRKQIQDLTNSNADTLRARTDWYDAKQMEGLDLLTGGNRAIMAKYGADIDNDVGTAVADARAGQSQAMNSAMRQAMRYGVSLPTTMSDLSTAGASQIAAAANNTRNNSINNYRNLVAQGIGQRDQTFRTSQTAMTDAMSRKEGALTTARSQRIQDEAIRWGRSLDVAGLGRGMVGASQGAYGLATTAGTNAATNQMASSGVLMNGMNSAANTMMQGRQIAQTGLNGVLSSATGFATQNARDMNDLASSMVGYGLGGLGGTGAGGFAWSDRRLKTEIKKLSDDPRGFSWYEFRYLWGGPKRVGVMADEVARVLPHAVLSVGGYQAVRYGAL